jgi:hypothetical protein
MNCTALAGVRSFLVAFGIFHVFGVVSLTRAQAPADCARQPVVSRARPRYVRPASATLGTFYPTPYLMVGGSWPTGSGYSPNNTYGDSTLSLYGPLSPLRTATAPVLGYARGYDGRTYLVEANSFSYPNLPEVSPVVYPTEANNFYAPRVNKTPRWGSSAINWIDQN